MDSIERHREWKRKHPDFPLTVSPNGQWSKKVRGQTIYFGRLDDRDAALELWLAERDHLLAGLPVPSHSDCLTVGDLCGRHMAVARDRLAVGELSSSAINDYQAAEKFLSTETKLLSVPIRLLSPEHFTAARQGLAASGRRPRTQKNLLTLARPMNVGLPTEARVCRDMSRITRSLAMQP